MHMWLVGLVFWIAVREIERKNKRTLVVRHTNRNFQTYL